MPQSLTPGIYVDELSNLPHPIDRVSTGTARFIETAASGFPFPRGFNQLRFFPAQGDKIWGGRTSSQDLDWQYVNIRRLVIFIEQSIYRGIQWAVFEPNGPTLWAALTSSIEGFLTSQWQSGSLQGDNRHDAFFVRCDQTVMTQNDVDNGRFVILVGIAPVKPAEFVVFQLTGQTKKKKK